ncbi:hypothetical protein ABZV25_08740, partial [Micrococcus luteus]
GLLDGQLHGGGIAQADARGRAGDQAGEDAGGPAGRGLRDDLARWDREDIRTLTRLLDRLAAERQTRMQDPAESE